MGYSTDFAGELKFTVPLTGEHLAKLNAMFGEDCREHPEWTLGGKPAEACYIDFELLPDFTGLRWNGAEKTYGTTDVLNLIIQEMRKVVPEFGLSGRMEAQGEDIEDRWAIEMQDGRAVSVQVEVPGVTIVCPHCERQFRYVAEKS